MGLALGNTPVTASGENPDVLPHHKPTIVEKAVTQSERHAAREVDGYLEGNNT